LAKQSKIVEEKKKHIAIIGSTGSIGTQALDVIGRFPDHFVVEVLTANGNAPLLIEQAKKFKPNVAVICDESKYKEVEEALWPEGIKVYTGYKSLEEVVRMEPIDMVLTAVVGFAGLRSTVSAIDAGKDIALANKETLVVAGDIITELASQRKVKLLPVDSEHSAIFQCLAGEWHNPVEKIYLTASGGPFRGHKREELATVSREQALKHPNWSMGAKITIDSASMMNKGLEVIEAHWLFGLKANQIKIVIHPQSIIHSIIEFADSSMKAQMGLPDMRIPIQYALAFPWRLPVDYPRLNFEDLSQLTFEKPDFETFENLQHAYRALERGGNLACVMNAANEVAVDAFLNGRIRFLEIAELIGETMEAVPFQKRPTIPDYEASDAQARNYARQWLNK